MAERPACARPPPCSSATEAYLDGQDALGAWLDECSEHRPERVDRRGPSSTTAGRRGPRRPASSSCPAPGSSTLSKPAASPRQDSTQQPNARFSGYHAETSGLFRCALEQVSTFRTGSNSLFHLRRTRARHARVTSLTGKGVRTCSEALGRPTWRQADGARDLRRGQAHSPAWDVRSWRPISRNKVLEQVRSILVTYQEYGAMTVRQIFYRLVATCEFPKTEQAYGRLAELLVNARRAREIPMAAVRDDGRTLTSPGATPPSATCAAVWPASSTPRRCARTPASRSA